MRRKRIIYCFSCFYATHTNCDFCVSAAAPAAAFGTVAVAVIVAGFIFFCRIFFTSGVV